MRLRRMAWVALAWLGMSACSKDVTVAVQENPSGNALPVDHPPVPNLGTVSSQGQRLSIAQLRASLPVLMGSELDGGPVTWRLGNGQPGLDAMALSLQEPDFVQITQEDLSPSPLYLKFMDDAARDVCNRALNADFQRTGTARVLLPFVSNTDTPATNLNGFNQNLRFLKLKLHPGRAGALGREQGRPTYGGYHGARVSDP